MRTSRRRLLALALAAAFPAFAQEEKKKAEDNSFDQDSVLKDAEAFFGKGAEGLGKVIEKAFKDHGRPNAYIKGEEAAGAIAVGLLYGNGHLVMKNAKPRRVYWQGPSIGFDLGGNLAKVFVLVYRLPRAGAIFQRFPAVDGSLYLVAGVGMNYQRSSDITVVPIRAGVGLRAGASFGYVHYTRESSVIPF